MTVMEVRMEESLQNWLSHLLGRHTRLLPRLDHKVDSVFHNHLSDLAGRLVQNQTKVILSSHESSASVGETRLPWTRKSA